MWVLLEYCFLTYIGTFPWALPVVAGSCKKPHSAAASAPDTELCRTSGSSHILATRTLKCSAMPLGFDAQRWVNCSSMPNSWHSFSNPWLAPVSRFQERKVDYLTFCNLQPVAYWAWSVRRLCCINPPAAAGRLLGWVKARRCGHATARRTGRNTTRLSKHAAPWRCGWTGECAGWLSPAASVDDAGCSRMQRSSFAWVSNAFLISRCAKRLAWCKVCCNWPNWTDRCQISAPSVAAKRACRCSWATVPALSRCICWWTARASSSWVKANANARSTVQSTAAHGARFTSG